MDGATVLAQFPRFSEYDPGATGEGSIDPLGFAALADQIADRLAPGIRARMSQPRFVTLSAIGALACSTIRDMAPSDGTSTIDLAFEWLVVESLARYPSSDCNPNRLRGVPGSQKATRALRAKHRLGAASYLAGPRVFGFTGVYRPFSQDAGVLDQDDRPGRNALELVAVWEQDQGLSGFLGEKGGAPGFQLRRELERECLSALRAGHVTAPPTGWLMKKIAECMAPQEIGARERTRLRDFIADSRHESRNEISRLLAKLRPPEDASQLQVAQQLAVRATPATRRALEAAIAFENCATALDHAFRRLLAYGMSLGGAFSVVQGTKTPHLGDLALRLPTLAKRAIDYIDAFDPSLTPKVVGCFEWYEETSPPAALIEALIGHHERVQTAKGKRMWIDPLRGRWMVRPQAPRQRLDLLDEVWSHPMRISTLAEFLRATEA